MASEVKWAPSRRHGQMQSSDMPTRLLILGVHVKSEGYPNTMFRIRDLENSELFHISEINFPLPFSGPRLTKGKGALYLTKNFCLALVAHIKLMARYLAGRHSALVYVPYPSVFVLFLLSLLPRRLRPRHVVADAFISIYDTVVLDRNLLREKSLLARTLKCVERRAYRSASKIVADTHQNKRFLCSTFGLPDSRVVDVPLSIDESSFIHTPYTPSMDVCHVLFVGTLIPLHGVETILGAAHLLADRADIHIKLIGDGQDGTKVEEHLRAGRSNVDWVRSWQSSESLAQEVSRADICLGIFGGGDKTQRVCPLKIYAYTATGRAIITGDTRWLRDMTIHSSPFATVQIQDAKALAEKIILLADNVELRSNLAKSSRAFFDAHLGNKTALEKLVDCLSSVSATP